MADIVSPEKRSRMMASIRGKNTKPEVLIRSGLHKLGYRFRIHDKTLPGKPDLKLRKHKAVIFVHGCFWHSHDCHLFKMPSSRVEFWKKKFETNVKNDQLAISKLKNYGWRVCIIWECSLKGRTRLGIDDVLKMCSEWLESNKPFFEIKGS